MEQIRLHGWRPTLSVLCSLQPGYARTSAMLLCTWKGKRKPWQPSMRLTGPCSRVASWPLSSPKPSLWSTRWDPAETPQVRKSPRLRFRALLLPSPVFTRVFPPGFSLQVDSCPGPPCPLSIRAKQRCWRQQQQLQLDCPSRRVGSGAGLRFHYAFGVFVAKVSPKKASSCFSGSTERS